MDSPPDVKPSTSQLHQDLDQSFSAECNICTYPFNEENLRPVIRPCGHTVCEVCAKKVKTKCPSCQAPITPSGRQKLVYNYQLMQQIRNQQEMKDLLKAAKEKSRIAEDEVKRLQDLANRGNEYMKALKCKECEFPMKEGFFCLDCLVIKSEQELYDVDESNFKYYCGLLLCGGCLKKHEKRKHTTAELEEIMKTRQAAQFQKETGSILNTFNQDFSKLATVFSELEKKNFNELNKKVTATFKAIKTAFSSLPASSNSHLHRLQEDLQQQLSDLRDQTDNLVEQLYKLRGSIEDVTDAADSITSACGYIEDEEGHAFDINYDGSNEEEQNFIKNEPVSFISTPEETGSSSNIIDGGSIKSGSSLSSRPAFPNPDENGDEEYINNIVKDEPISFIEHRSPLPSTSSASASAGGWQTSPDSIPKTSNKRARSTGSRAGPSAKKANLK